jgi:SAM-dependent methyltransferase
VEFQFPVVAGFVEVKVSVPPGTVDLDYERYAALARRSPLAWLEGMNLRGRRVLHAGCGSGVTTVGLTRWFESVTGTDYNPGLIEVARRRHPHPRIRYLPVDFVEFEDAAGFDLVFVYMTMHEVDDLEKAMVNVKRLTRPGGRVVIVDRIVEHRWASHTHAFADAVTNLLPDIVARGACDAAWLFRYRTNGERMAHLAGDGHLTRWEFVRRFGPYFPGAKLTVRGLDRAVYWTKPAS